MRRILGVAFAATVVGVPAGLAASMPGHHHPPTPARHGHPPVGKHGVKPCVKPPRHGIRYIIRGVVVSDVQPGDTSFLVDVTRVNAHAKKALAGPSATGGGAYSAMIPVQIDRCTFITKNRTGLHRRPATVLDHGDRVVIGWKAARGKTYLQLGPADRIVDLARPVHR